MLYVSYDGLTALMHVHMLNSDLLLPFATVTVERLKQSCVGTRELVGLVQMVIARRESVDSEIFYLLEGRVDDHPTHRRTALPGSAPFFIALPRSVRRLLPLRGRLIGRGVGLRRSFAAGSGTLFGIWPRPAVCRRDWLLGGL